MKRRVYAQTNEQALAYIKKNYDGEKSSVEHKSAECACGESDAYWISDEGGTNTVEVVIVCESCYENGTHRDRV